MHVLTVTRDLTIDAATHDFTPINRLAIGRDGSIGVWQQTDRKILFFDASGKPTGSFGRKGAGPGEFQYLGNQGWTGDTLWVADGRRITTISPTHKLIETVVIPGTVKASASDSTPLPVSAPTLQARLPDGRSVMSVSLRRLGARPSWAPAGETRAPVILMSSSGAFLQLVGWMAPFLTPECTVHVNAASMEAFLGLPFCALPLSAWSDDGARLALVTQENAPGTDRHYSVRVAAATGATLFARDYSYRAIPIPQRVIDSNLAMRTDPRNKDVPEVTAAWRAMKVPPSYPPVRRLLAGRDGAIWLELETGTATHRWQVLSEKGDVIGLINLPQNVELKAVSRSAVWGVEKDQDDLESVVRYKVGP